MPIWFNSILVKLFQCTKVFSLVQILDFHTHTHTSVLAAAVFLVVFTLALRLGALSPTSSSECSALVSDWSELC